MTFFLIDDDHDDQEFFQLAIDSLNQTSRFYGANNGHDAIRCLGAEDSVIPDLIFIDMNMPRMSGRECIQNLRQLSKLKHVPMVLYSTSDRLIGNEEALRAGADYFFTKPGTIPEWALAIKGVLSKLKEKGLPIKVDQQILTF